jgi:hypothetical protein
MTLIEPIEGQEYAGRSIPVVFNTSTVADYCDIRLDGNLVANITSPPTNYSGMINATLGKHSFYILCRRGGSEQHRLFILSAVAPPSAPNATAATTNVAPAAGTVAPAAGATTAAEKPKETQISGLATAGDGSVLMGTVVAAVAGLAAFIAYRAGVFHPKAAKKKEAGKPPALSRKKEAEVRAGAETIKSQAKGEEQPLEEKKPEAFAEEQRPDADAAEKGNADIKPEGKIYFS